MANIHRGGDGAIRISVFYSSMIVVDKFIKSGMQSGIEVDVFEDYGIVYEFLVHETYKKVVIDITTKSKYEGFYFVDQVLRKKQVHVDVVITVPTVFLRIYRNHYEVKKLGYLSLGYEIIL